MSQIGNDVLSMFQSASAAFATAEANTGEGVQGEWPPAGKCRAFIAGLTIAAGTVKQTTQGQPEEKFPCADVQFEYTVIPDDKAADFDPARAPLTFKGKRFQVLPGYESKIKEDGRKTGMRIDMDRLKGHLSKVLREDPSTLKDLGTAVTRAKALIEGPTKVGVDLNIEYRDVVSKKPGGKTATYKTEFITENVTG